jgi:hypothetical protein
MRTVLVLLTLCGVAAAQEPDLERARANYQRGQKHQDQRVEPELRRERSVDPDVHDPVSRDRL